MKFFDSHCHFDFPIFDDDREAVWHRCRRLGIQQLIVPGVSPEQWHLAAAITTQFNNIYNAVGLHPWWIKKDLTSDTASDYLAQLREQLTRAIKQCNSIAVGECGLDGSIDLPIELQQKILDVHLELAQELSLPIIIHCHKAHNELFESLTKYTLSAGGVIHAFSGSYELANRYWKMGLYLGVGGTITYERAKKTRDAVTRLPLEAVLLETDAPDMPLNGKQGQRNTPESVVEIAQCLADLRGTTLDFIAEQTTFNAQRLFKITPDE